MPEIAIIIVGLNASKYVKACLESLQKAEWRGWTHEVIYVDNGSSDDTLEMLAGFPDVRLIANKTNRGFCKAANQGAEITNAPFLFFLNDDTVVLHDAVVLLAETYQQVPSLGVIASRLFYPDMTEQFSGRKFPSMLNAILGRRSLLTRLFPKAAPVSQYLCKAQLNQTDPFEVDWVSAAAMMVSREAFDLAGGLAEDYYYWHEAIFCDRVFKAGKRVYLHPRSWIIHHEGKGSGSRPFSVRKWHIIDFHRAAYRCYCQHYDLERLSPWRWLALTALAVRAGLLLAANRIVTLGKRVET